MANLGDGSKGKVVKSISEQPSDHLKGVWSNFKKFCIRYFRDCPQTLFYENCPHFPNHRDRTENLFVL